MKRYRYLKIFALCSLVAIVLTSQVLLPLLDSAQAYPLSTWNMFTFSPGLNRDFVLQISFPGEEPCYTFQCPKFSATERKKIYWATQPLGQAFRMGDQHEIAARVASLGHHYEIRAFTLFERVCNPITCVLTGKAEHMWKLREFGP